jgi:ABC-type Zn uptake system ZnuABC Zn-binding protein ZnuA
MRISSSFYVSFFVLAAVGVAGAEPLRVATTTPDLASIAESIGGEDVQVTSLAIGGQDPHFIEPRPSFIRVLSRTDLFVTMGLQLELGWVPPLLRNSRNSRIQPGGAGALDASAVVPLVGVMTGVVDRSMGDVHPMGNPHYLLDPVNGIRVAREIRDKLADLRPERADAFRERCTSFEARVVEKLVGAEAVKRHGSEALAAAALEDRVGEIVPPSELGGWMASLQPDAGKSAAADHNLWPYFAKRFGFEVVAFLEPYPGIAPTTRHLGDVADQMKRDGIRVIMSAAYFHPRSARKVAEATGATIVEMADQVGSREGVDDYVAMIDWNVSKLADAL